MSELSRRRNNNIRIEESSKNKNRVTLKQKIIAGIAVILAIFSIVQVVALCKYTLGKSVKESSLWLYRAFQQEESGDN